MRKLEILFLFLTIFTLGANAQNSERPNVIFILADDLGAGDLQSTGHPYAKTPHLDKLAAKGVRFERAYMAAAWCAPSRYGLMSGQYPARDFNMSKNLKCLNLYIDDAILVLQNTSRKYKYRCIN